MFQPRYEREINVLSRVVRAQKSITVFRKRASICGKRRVSRGTYCQQISIANLRKSARPKVGRALQNQWLPCITVS
jgi:hypothetical protein